MKHVGKSESIQRIPCVLMADLMTNRWRKKASVVLDNWTYWPWSESESSLIAFAPEDIWNWASILFQTKFKFKRTIVAKHSQLLTKYLTEVVLWMSNMLSKGSMQITQWSIKSNIQYIVWLVWPFIDVTVQLNCI